MFGRGRFCQQLYRRGQIDLLNLPVQFADLLNPRSLEQGVSGVRIAYNPNLGYAEVEPEIAALVKAAVEVFAELGAIVEEVDPGGVA
jgi:Asp-tRNA(Asn)/Glu-tRNA(Gln) amidotransferase A subunit family amidase